ncbi:MAG: oligoendopeptidase F [Ignavibacteriales bacterium]|nr:MAG: oligoendopeptidase F [Ignavibacteriales bacterium]
MIRESSIFYKDESGTLPERDQIDPRHTWDYTHIISSDAEWEETFKAAEARGEKYASYEGKLGESPDILHECLIMDEETGSTLERLHLYAMLRKDTDLRDNTYQAMYERVKSLYAALGAKSSFIRPELLTIDEDLLNSWLEGYEHLSRFRHFFDDLLRTKNHVLDTEQERLLATVAEITTAGYDAFSILSNSDIEFPETTDEQGQTIRMSHGRYYSALYSKDRGFRERGYTAYLKPFETFANTFSVLLNNALKRDAFYAKTRNYASSLEAALEKNAIPAAVYNNLLESVSSNIAPMHRWVALKAKKIGTEKIHPYDMYVSLFEAGAEKKFTFDEAFELILEAFKPMGDEYVNTVKAIYDERRIDVYETRGKRSGAYSSGAAHGMKPYILMNWNGLLNDVFTLAHEIGHNVHSTYSGNNQPFIYADYTIFLAEIASTFNEALLFDHLIANADAETKRPLLEKYLNDITATFYRQTMFAEFELETHSRIEKGEFLSARELSEAYSRVYNKYNGPAMDMGHAEQFSWARIPHFYYNFYVYQYATGFAASAELNRLLKQNPDELIPKYIQFLKSGSSDYSLPILFRTGVDLTRPEPVAAVAARMNTVLDELESII